MSRSILDAAALCRALSVRDLSDPAEGAHALQLLVDSATSALVAEWGAELILQRRSPVVSVADNYDRLHYPEGGAARDERYTCYVCDVALLRTQTSAMIPPLLMEIAHDPRSDLLLACPGLVYRRDCIDRLHTGEPHQLDLWRIRRGAPLGVPDLERMIATVVAAVLPGRAHRVLLAEHPYTTDGLQIDVRIGDDWVEIGECGLALPALLAESGLPVPATTGLAMGLGLDRILMLRKGIDDIRLLRSDDARIAGQMLDLAPYQPVSRMPPVRRDLSLVLDAPTTSEELGDAVRAALGDRASAVENVELVLLAPCAKLPPAARERLGIAPGQVNALVRVVLRALDRTLTHDECNAIRDDVYAALHRGSVWSWAGKRSP